MRDSFPHLIDSFLDDAGRAGQVALSRIQRRALMLINLNRAVNSQLSVLLRPWCRVANVRQGVIVMETANASWKMRLCYEQPQLLSALRVKILPSLLSIDIRINPGLARKQELNVPHNVRDLYCYQDFKKNRCLSLESAAYIRDVAGRSEGKLKKILERLAKLAGESGPSVC
ncbi:DUF721 domain-containing protein [Candidatus Steffania adelgidicola]|uniref:DUF721 domain-containing protein n=1 Tax=Candidatus Steffania adelgidicola TaxID=1076626 RepID=UPI001D022BA1|nr:DciA family protein [Candidatus Steffania adelgidicola]UDG80142.1 hypothetical protein GFK82_00710 [Candidatus Steffania adelgidicola]